MHSPTFDSQGSPWRVGVVAGGLFFLLSVLWALASPIGSIPDEPSHFIRAIAAAQGDLRLTERNDASPHVLAEVPPYAAELHQRLCFIKDANTPAACEVTSMGDPDEMVLAPTSANLNGPVYYLLVGWPSHFATGDLALYLMRMTSAALAAVMMGCAVGMVRKLGGGPVSAVAAFALATPMLVYLSGSLNPNAVEASAAGALFVGLTGLARLNGRGAWLASGLVVAATLLVSSARSMGILWIAIAAVATLMLNLQHVRSSLVRSAPFVTSVGTSAAIMLGVIAWHATAPVEPAGTLVENPATVESAVLLLLLNGGEFARGYVGVFGWLDTFAPAWTYVVYSATLPAIVVAATVVGGRAGLRTMGFLCFVVVIGPAVIQGALAPVTGAIWQGRYMLGAVVIIIFAAGLIIDREVPQGPPAIWRPILVVGTAAMAAMHVLTFASVMRRYTVGNAGTIAEMLTRAQWQPPMGWVVLTLCYGLVIAACVLTVRRAVTNRAAAMPT